MTVRLEDLHGEGPAAHPRRVDGITDTRPLASAGTRSDPREARFLFALAAIALVALTARVVYVLLMRDHPIFLDSRVHHFRALVLADGRGFLLPVREIFGVGVDEADASVAPGWTVLLGGAAFAGVRSILSQQLVSCVIGAGTVAMTGLAGRAGFGRRVGLTAAVLAAIYPNVWLYERELVSEPLAMLGVATIMWLAYRFIAAPSTWLAVAIGLATGLLALTRAEQLLLLPLLVVPLVIRVRSVDLRRRLVWVTAACGVSLLTIAPWTAYNATRFDLLVPISTGFGTAFRNGNCPLTYHGAYLGYAAPPTMESSLICGPTTRPIARDQSRLDRQQRQAAIDYVRDHPRRAMLVSAARLGRTFGVYRPLQQVHFEGARLTPLWILQGALFSYWVLVPLAAYGVVLSRRRKIPVYPLLVPFAIVAITVAATIGAVRYRASAEIPLVILAAIAVEALVRSATRSSRC